MTKQELQRLIKIEGRIVKIAKKHGLEFHQVEFDVVPPQKMMEIMAYRLPTNVNNWKYGRDYERQRTIYEHMDAGLPYEVVINSDPARAYLMNSNTLAVQALVMAHVYGHAAFHTMNKHHERTRGDILDYMLDVSKRIEKYEKLYGINEVEKIIDAGHSIQFHSSPFESSETETDRRKRVYEQKRRKTIDKPVSDFGDISDVGNIKQEYGEDMHLYNQKLLKSLELKTPVEPTEDLLRYIIDNSSVLTEWHKDILEALRVEGQHYWPTMRTRFMNEGFATYFHEIIMNELFEEGDLTTSEHSQYNYSNSLVQAMNPISLNPYNIGNAMWKDIVDRWDKGKYGFEYDNCENYNLKKNWDTKEMNGRKKMFEILDSYTDWFFFQNFLTPKLINELKLYVYVKQEDWEKNEWIITGHEAKEMAQIIISSFSHSGIPQIEITNGNGNNKGDLILNHKWQNIDLNSLYATETMKHIYNLWGRSIFLETKVLDKDYMYMVNDKDIKSGFLQIK